MKNIIKKLIKKILIEKRGETLIEAIIAISVLVLVLAPASAMIVSSNGTILMNRNDLVAAALAEEGLEVVKNIRDTNLIRFAQKTDACWNTSPNDSFTLVNCSDAQNKIGGNDKVSDVRILNLQMDPDNLRWMIDNNGAGVPGAPAPLPPIENYHLYYDTATNTDPECPNVGPCHSHTGIYFYPTPSTLPPLPRGKLSPFYRQVEIQYVDIDADGNVDPIMKVTSNVSYEQSGGKMRTIKRILFLTNKPAL